MHRMVQFSLKRLLITTAVIAVGIVPWTLSSPHDRATAFFGAPLVCGAIGYLFRQTAFGVVIGILIAAAVGAIRAPDIEMLLLN
jgi:hypothetical protein